MSGRVSGLQLVTTLNQERERIRKLELQIAKIRKRDEEASIILYDVIQTMDSNVQREQGFMARLDTVLNLLEDRQ